MLVWFRNNAKIFLIVIVVIFVGMIFLEWGRGGLDRAQADKMVMGTVNGQGIDPAQFDMARREIYGNMEDQMSGMGYPNAESQLALMYNDINEAAFDLVIDRTLQNDYLEMLGWSPVRMSMAEELLETQLMLMGIQDPEGYIAEYRNDPNFGGTLQQVVYSADRAMFGSAVSLENMISMEELEFMLNDAMTSVSARFVTFRASPPLPSVEELEIFYDENPELFNRTPGSRIRFATFMIQPGENDLALTMGMVDSLAVSGGGSPDTMNIIREQLETITGWSVDMSPGEVSRPFTAASLASSGIQACHSIELLDVSASDDTSGAGDTLTIVHWEVPLFPGRNTLREAFWDLDASIEDILAREVPSFGDYQLVDFGEMVIDGNTQPSESMPQPLISFATDTIWASNTGPVFYIPSFSGSYPALMLAEKTEEIEGGTIPLEEALESNLALTLYYSRLQNEAALRMAEEAAGEISGSGMGLGEWARSDSIEVQNSQPFSPASVRQWSASDEAAYRGFLGCEGLANAALTAQEFTLIGPFTNNGVAYLAEIVSRTDPQIPEERSQLTGFYLSMQNSHNSLYTARLMENMRDQADIVDSREQYYNTMDSLRADYAARQEALEE